MQWVVYVLKHPRTGDVRYVGWTRETTRRRLNNHISESTKKQRTHKQRWILSLVSIGLFPVIEVVECGHGDGWEEAERRWIAHYRAAGAKLVNATEGGEGIVGWGTFEQRSILRKQDDARMEPGARAARTRAMWAKRTPEERAAIADKVRRSLTAEERSAQARATWARMSREQRNALHAAAAKITPTQRAAAAEKAWASEERRNQAARRLAERNRRRA